MTAAIAATLLAAAVTLHNAEEMRRPPRTAFPGAAWTPFSFRLAAGVIAALFWCLAGGLWLGLALEAVLSGFAAAMAVNAFVPHLALTIARRRYHPGTATGLLLVVPAALAWLFSQEARLLASQTGFLARAGAAVFFLAALLPVLLVLGRRIERA